MALKPLADRVQERLLALVARRRADPEAVLGRLRELRELDRIPAFAIALRHLAGLELPDAEAESLFTEILLHRMEMQRRLLRDPGLTVAMLDYLSGAGSRFTRQLREDGTELRTTSSTDALTGLATRGRLLTVLEGELRRALRSRDPVSVVLIELEDLDSYRDAHGDRIADMAVQRAALAIRRSVRETDTAALLGERRFAVLALATDLSGGVTVGRRLRAGVQGDFSVCAGVASAPADGRRASSILERAEEALAIGKECGEKLFAHHSERRAALRRTARSSVRGAIVRHSCAESHPAQPIDLSRRGALLATDGSVGVWEAVSLRLALEWDVAREIHGRVVRVAAGSPSGHRFRVGIRFDTPIPEDPWLANALASRSNA